MDVLREISQLSACAWKKTVAVAKTHLYDVLGEFDVDAAAADDDDDDKKKKMMMMMVMMMMMRRWWEDDDGDVVDDDDDDDGDDPAVRRVRVCASTSSGSGGVGLCVGHHVLPLMMLSMFV